MIPGSARLSPYGRCARVRVTTGTAAAGFATRQVRVAGAAVVLLWPRSPSRPARLTCTASEPGGTSRTVRAAGSAQAVSGPLGGIGLGAGRLVAARRPGRVQRDVPVAGDR